jgi:hypothetical protein
MHARIDCEPSSREARIAVKNPSTKPRRGRRFARLYAGAAGCVVASATFAVTAGPAAAIGTDVHRICNGSTSKWSEYDFCVGFDYNPTDNNLRAYGRIVRSASDGNTVHFSMKLVLGDGNGVISTVSSPVGVNSLTADSGATHCHLLNQGANYNVHVTFTIVTYLAGVARAKEIEDTKAYHWPAAGSGGACTAASATYYPYIDPYPPAGISYSTDYTPVYGW